MTAEFPPPLPPQQRSRPPWWLWAALGLVIASIGVGVGISLAGGGSNAAAPVTTVAPTTTVEASTVTDAPTTSNKVATELEESGIDLTDIGRISAVLSDLGEDSTAATVAIENGDFNEAARLSRRVGDSYDELALLLPPWEPELAGCAVTMEDAADAMESLDLAAAGNIGEEISDCAGLLGEIGDQAQEWAGN